MRHRDFARHVARESAIGCVTHLLLAVAGVIFLGGAAAYRGWVGKAVRVSGLAGVYRRSGIPWTLERIAPGHR
jgi:hypothetical protein